MQVGMNTFAGGAPRPDGVYRAWVDGQVVFDYEDICTLEQEGGDINEILMGGTMAQPAYDAPEHFRRFDALLLSDDWQDVLQGGYLQEQVEADAGPQHDSGGDSDAQTPDAEATLDSGPVFTDAPEQTLDAEPVDAEPIDAEPVDAGKGDTSSSGSGDDLSATDSGCSCAATRTSDSGSRLIAWLAFAALACVRRRKRESAG